MADSAIITTNLASGTTINGSEQIVSITSSVNHGSSVSANVVTGGVGMPNDAVISDLAIVYAVALG